MNTASQPLAPDFTTRHGSPAHRRKADLPDPSWQWTARKAEAFIGALQHFGRVGDAAKAVGMSRQSAYRLRARLGDDALFARVWDTALVQGQEERQKRQGKKEKATALTPESDIFGIGK